MTLPPTEEATRVGDPAPPAPGARRTRARAAIAAPDTTRAIGLAAATMVSNLVAVAFTVVFARLLGADGYGSLAALFNLTVILFVPGYALQVATARAGTLGRLGRGGELSATLRRWTAHLAVGFVLVALAGALARDPLAALLNIDQQWAAAAVPLTAAVWLLLCVQRGLLQAARAYRAVGWSIALEATGRLLLGLVFLAAGGGVTGTYLGTTVAFLVMVVALDWLLRRRLGRPDPDTPRHPLPALARAAALPIAGLTLVAVLQNVDVIMAKHVLDEETAGVYAATAVAGKATVWIAIGLGLWVLPEATRREAEGRDPRVVLVRALVVIGAIAAVELLAFAFAPELVLRIAFGPDYEGGADVLLVLGIAYALLAATYLAVQFLLALHRRGFLVALALAAIALTGLLASADTLEGFAVVVLGVQAAAAAALFLPALRARAPA